MIKMLCCSCCSGLITGHTVCHTTSKVGYWSHAQTLFTAEGYTVPNCELQSLYGSSSQCCYSSPPHSHSILLNGPLTSPNCCLNQTVKSKDRVSTLLFKSVAIVTRLNRNVRLRGSGQVLDNSETGRIKMSLNESTRDDDGAEHSY